MKKKILKTLAHQNLAPGIQDFTKEDPWRIFRIMSEFVDSFEAMSKHGPLVTVFGSARTKPHENIYKDAVKIGRLFTENGYGVITGGGGGIMEAVNKGAYKADGTSIGLNIDLPMEQHPNKYLNRAVNFRYFFIRKVNFLKYTLAVVVYPGGFGTMDEMFETLTLIQTKKIHNIPVALVGKEFWTPMYEWLKKTLLDTEKISASDLHLFKIVGNADEAVKHVLKSHKKGKLKLYQEPEQN